MSVMSCRIPCGDSLRSHWVFRYEPRAGLLARCSWRERSWKLFLAILVAFSSRSFYSRIRGRSTATCWNHRAPYPISRRPRREGGPCSTSSSLGRRCRLPRKTQREKRTPIVGGACYFALNPQVAVCHVFCSWTGELSLKDCR